MKIKICGITKRDTLNFLIENEVDYVGFIFHENSPRCVTHGFIDEIKERLLDLDEGNKKVLINYKDIEISSGLSISSEVNLQKIMGNIEGIKNIEEIM